jgi:hypothetical protein
MVVPTCGIIDDMAKRHVKTHGVSGYRAGCRCITCTMAESERKRNYRATGTGSKSGGVKAARNSQDCADTGNVTPIRVIGTGKRRTAARGTARGRESLSEPKVGINEEAVRDQCAASARAADQPATVAQAITLSRILDNDRFAAIHANVGRQLNALMMQLDGPKTKRKGRLAVVTTMVSGKVAE